MRIIFSVALGLLMLSTPAFPQSAPPSVKGQRDSAYMRPKPNLQVPNKQATNLGGLDVLLETGNSDILINGSFENTTSPTDGFTAAPMPVGLELTDVTDGKQSIYFTPSNFPLELSQDSTIGASAFSDGTLQGLATCRVKVSTDATIPVHFCPRRAGAIVPSLCKTVPSNGLWNQMEVPFILGLTSNGLSVHSQNYDNITATKISVDSCKLLTNVQVTGEVGVVGPWISFTPTATWNTNVTFRGRWRQVGTSAEIQYAWDLTGAPNAASLAINLPPGLTIDADSLASVPNAFTAAGGRLTDLGSNSFPVYPQVSSLALTSISIASVTSATNTAVLTVSNTAPFTWANTDYGSANITVPIREFAASTSTYLSTNGNTSWAPCGHTTSDFQGFGTVTNIETQCKRDGDDLLMRGKFTSSTPTAVEARVNLKLNGTSLTSSGTSKIPSIQRAGGGAFSQATASEGITLIEPSVGYITFATQSGSAGGLTKANGSSITGAGTIYSFTARIPIAGWENSNLMIGSFRDVVTSPDSVKPVTYDAFVGTTGTVTEYGADWINGNAVITDTSLFTLNIHGGRFLNNPRCFPVTYTTVINGVANVDSTTLTATTVGIRTSTATSKTAHGFFIKCDGIAP